MPEPEEITGVTPEPTSPVAEIVEPSHVEEPTQVEPQTPEPELVQDPASQGQLSALVAEREKRQTVEKEREFYKQMALGQGQQQQPPQNEPQYDPEDLTTYDAVNQMVDNKINGVQEQIRSSQIMQMEQQAKAQYPDWESVIILAEEMARSQPGLGQAILAAENPAETAYMIGKTHTRYSQIQNQRVTSEVADKINSNLNKTPTLSNVGSGQVPDQGERWKTATSTDLEAEIARVKGF